MTLWHAPISIRGFQYLVGSFAIYHVLAGIRPQEVLGSSYLSTATSLSSSDKNLALRGESGIKKLWKKALVYDNMTMRRGGHQLTTQRTKMQQWSSQRREKWPARIRACWPTEYLIYSPGKERRLKNWCVPAHMWSNFQPERWAFSFGSIQVPRRPYHVDHAIHRIPRTQSHRLFASSIPHLCHCNKGRGCWMLESRISIDQTKCNDLPSPASKIPRNSRHTIKVAKVLAAAMQDNAIPQQSVEAARNFPIGTLTRR